FVSMLKKKPAIDKKPEQAVNFRTLVPQDFAEEDTSCSASSSEINQSRFNSLSRKKEALPPVVSRVTTLLCEAESKATSRDFAKSVELLEKATTLGSACAAAKLGLVYHGGLNSTVNPDYASAAAYYFLALKLIYMIPNNKWDMSLLLDVIAG
ncbi:17087_t:CDS:1, partial [Funneliformis geosporum]